MSEEATTMEAPQPAEGTRSPVEPKVSTEVTPTSQEPAEEQSSEVNQLIADAKKYRSRAQKSESELALRLYGSCEKSVEKK